MPQGLDQRFGSRGIQLSAQVRNVRFDHVGMMLPFEIVEMFQQFLLGNNRTRPMNQIFENPILRWREIKGPSAAADRLLNRIQLQIGHYQNWGRNSFGAPNE